MAYPPEKSGASNPFTDSKSSDAWSTHDEQDLGPPPEYNGPPAQIAWKEGAELEGYEAICVAYSPSGQQIALGTRSAKIFVWDLPTGEVHGPFVGHAHAILCVAFSPDGRSIASASQDGVIRVWDVATMARTHLFEGHSLTVYTVAFSPDGQQLASASLDKDLRLWDLTTGNCTTMTHPQIILCAAYSPDGRYIATGCNDSKIRFWHTGKGLVHHTLEGHLGAITCLAFSPDKNELASGSRDATIRVWDLASGKTRAVLSNNLGEVTSVAFSAGQIASTSDDKTIRIWDAATGRPREKLQIKRLHLRDLAFSPDKSQLASIGNSSIRLWEPVGTRRQVYTPDTAPAEQPKVGFWKSVKGIRKNLVTELPIFDKQIGWPSNDQGALGRSSRQFTGA
ncbi:hypothetical protein MMC25_006305 [Agyrium rufum]|nr:hypothetical protein [Agyrium rufum]